MSLKSLANKVLSGNRQGNISETEGSEKVSLPGNRPNFGISKRHSGIAVKIYSPILGAYLWVVADDEALRADMVELRKALPEGRK